MILAGDAGATKTELALFSNKNDKLEKIISQKFSSSDFSSLDDIVRAFLKDKNHKIDSACIGVPGPVFGGKAKSTNLDWLLDEKILSSKLNLKFFKLANDLEAMAESVASLDKGKLTTIYKGAGSPKEGNKVLIAPGTGLGQAAIVCKDGKNIIVSSEGGHTDFAPQSDIEIELLIYLKKKLGHVSYERVASGEGILNIFEFLYDTGFSIVDERILMRIKNEDAAAVISDEGLTKNCKLCEKAIAIFASVSGAQAGNMVLNYNATGGVYLGGGIPLKIPQVFKSKIFKASYLNKGRMSYMTAMTPIHMIMDESAGLLGAAVLAQQILGGNSKSG